MEPIHIDHTSVQYLHSFLDLANVPERKCLVMLCRAQVQPRIVSDEDTDPLSKMALAPIKSLLFRASKLLADSSTDLLLHHISFFFSSALSGYTINYLYRLPLTMDDIKETREKSFITEFQVTQDSRRDPVINWRPILYPKHNNEQLNPIIPADPNLYRAIHDHMITFKRSYKYRTIFPEVSKRGVSHSTQHSFKQSLDAHPDIQLTPYTDITPLQLLQLYLQTGEVTHGASEMRQVWYPTGLKPRTYFAQGGTAYFSSLYLKTFFNSLADIFVFTNRFHRVDTSRLQLQKPNGEFIIYDYSSFTSNFSEQYYFLKELAGFFEDCSVFIMGPNLSKTMISLGSLIDDYAEVCNNNPSFNVGKSAPFEFADTLYHIQAGFLGVFGNLMTCTVPHGIVARSLSTSDSSTSTAGDDGTIEPKSAYELAIRSLQLLGDLAYEKCFFSNHPSIFLKLPFQTVDNEVCVSPRLEFPNLNFCCYGDMDPRFNRLQDLSIGDRRYMVYRQVVRFMQALPNHTEEIYDYEYGIIAAIINGITNKMRLRNDGRGDTHISMSTTYQGHLTLKALPELDWRDLTNTEYLRYFPRTDPRELIRVRRRGEPTYHAGDPIEEGDTYLISGGRAWKYLENCGYIRFVDYSVDFDDDADYVYVMAKDLVSYKEVGPELRHVEVLTSVSGSDMKVLYDHPEAVYIEAVEVIQTLDSKHNRKRLRRAFTDSRYVDLDDPTVIDVTSLEYDDSFYSTTEAYLSSM